MSCNGCRVLRKGCSDTCVLRPCLQWIDGAESQGHATVFVAKFFGRAGLMSFISAVPQSQRPALFQSLLYEACGRTINPVGGAVALLAGGNWDLCQMAVETVLRGGALLPISGATDGTKGDFYDLQCSFSSAKKITAEEMVGTAETPAVPAGREQQLQQLCELELGRCAMTSADKKSSQLRRRPGTPNSEESGTSSAESTADRTVERSVPQLLNLFV